MQRTACERFGTRGLLTAENAESAEIFWFSVSDLVGKIEQRTKTTDLRQKTRD